MSLFENLNLAVARPLMAGGVFLIAWALAAQVPTLLRRWLAGRGDSRWQRLAGAPAWPFVGRILALAYAIGALYLILQQAYIEPSHIGLGPLRWEELAPWLPVVAGLTSLWVAILWAAVWRDLRPSADHSPRAAYGTILGLPAHLIGEEAWAAILRGALIPALGLYWGPLAAALARGLVSLVSPSARDRCRADAGRPFAYLDWAMEWVAAGCFIASGSLWASLIARAAGHLAANLVHRGLYLWARHRAQRGSVETG